MVFSKECLTFSWLPIKQVAPTLIKADVPWSVRRGTLSDKERVLKTVKG